MCTFSASLTVTGIEFSSSSLAQSRVSCHQLTRANCSGTYRKAKGLRELSRVTNDDPQSRRIFDDHGFNHRYRTAISTYLSLLSYSHLRKNSRQSDLHFWERFRAACTVLLWLLCIHVVLCETLCSKFVRRTTYRTMYVPSICALCGTRTVFGNLVINQIYTMLEFPSPEGWKQVQMSVVSMWDFTASLSSFLHHAWFNNGNPNLSRNIGIRASGSLIDAESARTRFLINRFQWIQIYVVPLSTSVHDTLYSHSDHILFSLKMRANNHVCNSNWSSTAIHYRRSYIHGSHWSSEAFYYYVLILDPRYRRWSCMHIISVRTRKIRHEINASKTFAQGQLANGTITVCVV